MDASLSIVRQLLEDVTPLKADCGRICGAACCASLPGEETGMLLFPGEEPLYRGKPGWKLLRAGPDPLAVCPGRCAREERPLSCRLFPLLPVLRDGAVHVETDLRARAVCPLARQGKSAMNPAFQDAVRRAGELLAEDGAQRAFLERLSRRQEELRALRKAFHGERS